MLDEREGAGRAAGARIAPSTASRCGSAPPSSPPGRSPTCCSRCCCTPRRNWIGIDEPKAVARRAAGRQPGRARRAARRRLGARRLERRQRLAATLRSMTDLRWEVTQAVLHGEPLHLLVTDARRPRPAQRRRSSSTARRAARSTPQLMQPHRPRRAVQRAGARRGARRRSGRAGRAARRRPRAAHRRRSRSPTRRGCAS